VIVSDARCPAKTASTSRADLSDFSSSSDLRSISLKRSVLIINVSDPPPPGHEKHRCQPWHGSDTSGLSLEQSGVVGT
jgi:hypothetical protein